MTHSTQVKALFNKVWDNYLEVTPSACKIQKLLDFGGELINDHVAYRTFNINKVNIEKLSIHLLRLGYKECGNYEFKAKKLVAKHYEHPDTTLPKVFISELLVEEFSPQVQKIIHTIIDKIDENIIYHQGFLYSGRTWEISSSDYETLLAESEYAAWVGVWGFRANHFTVSINHLINYTCIESVNSAVKSGGFSLNNIGGEIKGCEKVKLEQSSTLADIINVNFSDKNMMVPSCFYEFAKRYPLENGKLYSGFVAASADKIFESTNAAA